MTFQELQRPYRFKEMAALRERRSSYLNHETQIIGAEEFRRERPFAYCSRHMRSNITREVVVSDGGAV